MRHLKRSAVITAVLAAILGFVAVSVVAAPAVAAPTPEIEIGSFPVFTQKAIYFDSNKDGQTTPDELLGIYDVYNTATGVQFRWTLMPGANSYRVWMIQYDPPGKGPDGPSHVIKVGHHLISDPSPNQYTMIGWGVDETFCVDCVTVLVVQPETASLFQDDQGTYDYHYTPLPGLIVSAPFVMENWGIPKGGNGRRNAPVCGDGICNSKEKACGSLYYCPVPFGDCPDSCP